jgi:tetratricopeptide (TPR) repeat protein
MTKLRGFVLSDWRPFPGLRPFDFADSAVFFGREDQTAALYLLVDRSRFVAVIGSSGSGKSSLVRAGLLPLLEQESGSAGGRAWRWTTMHPGDAPLARLAEAVAKLSNEDDPVIGQASQERVGFALRQSRFGVAGALSEIDDLGDESVLIIVDQFEELFRYAGPGAPGRERIEEARWREEAVHFVQLLIEAGRDRSHHVHVLVTMRSDFIGDCARFHGLPEAVSASQFLVPALTRNQREEVIRAPLESVHASIEPELVEQLLNDSGDDFDQLPVLQHCLSRLWDRAGREPGMGNAREHRHLSRDQYGAIGAMAGALSEHAEDVLADLRGEPGSADAARLDQTVEQVFRALAEVDKEGRVTRRVLPFGQLTAETGMLDGDVRAVVDRFRSDDCSFLVPPPFEVPLLSDGTRIDVGHEALIRRWLRVSADVAAGAPEPGWLRAEEADGRMFRGLQAIAESESGRIPNEIVVRRWRWWNERPRTAAWADRYGGGVDRVTRLFAESLAAREAEIAEQEAKRNTEQRRLEFEAQAAMEREEAAVRFARFSRAATIVVSTLLLVAMGLAGMFFKQRQDAQTHANYAGQQTAVAEKSFRVVLDTTIAWLDQIQRNLDRGTIKVSVAKELLTTSESNVAELESLRQTPALVVGRITLFLAFADVYSMLGDTKLALQRSEQALSLARTLVALDPGNKNWQRLVYASDFRIGDAVVFERNYERSRRVFEEALAIARDLGGDGPLADGQQQVVFVINKLADLSKLEGKWQDALRQYQAALAVIQRLVQKDPNRPDWQRDLATTRMRIGDLMQERDPQMALEQYTLALPVRERLAHGSDNDGLRSNLSVAYNRIGDMLKLAGKYDEALDRYNEALAIRQRLAAKDSGNAQSQSALAFQYIYLGDLLFAKQEFSGALERYRTAFSIRKQLADGDPGDFTWSRNLADNYVKLGEALAQIGKPDDALDSLRGAFALRTKLAVDFPSSARQMDLALAHIRIGDVLETGNRVPAALDEYRIARDILVPLAAKRYSNSEGSLQELERRIAKLSGTQ